MKLPISLLLLFVTLQNQAATIEFDNTGFVVSPQFSNVATFSFSIEVEGELIAKEYSAADVIQVDYSVSGSLTAGTPSGFPQFALERSISGDDFRDQGSSLSFQISQTADLSDGLQFDELVSANDPVFIFNGREINNERFHPALLELNIDGTGMIQNSNNQPVIADDPINFGAEYITDLTFDTRLTLVEPIVTPSRNSNGSLSFAILGLTLFLSLYLRNNYLRKYNQ